MLRYRPDGDGRYTGNDRDYVQYNSNRFSTTPPPPVFNPNVRYNQPARPVVFQPIPAARPTTEAPPPYFVSFAPTNAGVNTPATSFTPAVTNVNAANRFGSVNAADENPVNWRILSQEQQVDPNGYQYS